MQPLQHRDAGDSDSEASLSLPVSTMVTVQLPVAVPLAVGPGDATQATVMKTEASWRLLIRSQPL